MTDKFENNQYPEVFKQAVLLIVGMFDTDLEPSKESVITDNYLPAPVRALLYPYRTPTVI